MDDIKVGGYVTNMSLRDWFAGQALTGLIASNRANFPMPYLAHVAYEYADAMIRQRPLPTEPEKEP